MYPAFLEKHICLQSNVKHFYQISFPGDWTNAWPLVKFMAPSVVEIFSIVLFGIKRIFRPPHFLILQSPFASVLRIQFAHSNISCRHLSNHHWYLFQQNAPEMIWRFGCFKICQCWRSISILPLPSKFVRVHLYHCIDPSSTWALHCGFQNGPRIFWQNRPSIFCQKEQRIFWQNQIQMRWQAKYRMTILARNAQEKIVAQNIGCPLSPIQAMPRIG